MIELIHLPEFSATAQHLINLAARKSFPFGTLFQKSLFVCKRAKEMHMIGHDDDIC